MDKLNWLHLSDWHHKKHPASRHGRLVLESGRRTILQKLLKDIEKRKSIDSVLGEIDFCIFSGDIAFSGNEVEFQEASSCLIEPVRELIGQKVPIIFCPGNHDIDRSALPGIHPEWSKIAGNIDSYSEELEDMISESDKANHLRSPFTNFMNFTEAHGQKYEDGKLHYCQIIEIHGKQIGIASINTAWNSARFTLGNDFHSEITKIWDYGSLKITEAQLRSAASEIEHADVKIAVLHHPLNWLIEDEQVRIENFVRQHFDILLHGHEHRPNMNRLSGGAGDLLVIPAGATYNRRVATDPRYTNAYNYCTLDLSSLSGQIYHRIWSEEKDRWVHDDRYWLDGRSSFLINNDWGDDYQAKKSMLFDVEKRYVPLLKDRSVKKARVSVKHKAVTIDSVDCIEVTVRYEFTYEKGEEENFKILSRLNNQIQHHKSKAVRDFGYNIEESDPPHSEVIEDTEDGVERRVIRIPIEEDETTIVFQYKLLDTSHGTWVWTLSRYTVDVEFAFYESDKYEYEYLALGGFPRLNPEKKGIQNYKSLKSEGVLHLPGQGYLMQWYPKDVT